MLLVENSYPDKFIRPLSLREIKKSHSPVSLIYWLKMRGGVYVYVCIKIPDILSAVKTRRYGEGIKLREEGQGTK